MRTSDTADLLQESGFNFVDVASGCRLSLTAAPMSHGGGCILRAPGGPVDLNRSPLRVTRESTRSSAMSGPVSGKSRVPSPITTGYVTRMISSTRWLSNSQRTRRPLPCTCSSPAGLAFSSPMAAARSPERTVVFAQRGSESVVDATYLGFVFNAVQMGLSAGSAHDPQEPAKIS